LDYLAPVVWCRSGRWSGIGALLVGVLVPAVARAEAMARLVYVRGEGAADCPAEVDLRLWVIARLGYDPFSPQASRVVIARVEKRENRLMSSVEVADQDGLSAGRRELSSKNERCEDLARAMALSISLAIDPERASQARAEPIPAAGPAPAPSPSPPPPAPIPRARAPIAPPRVATSEAPRTGLQVRGVLETGVGQLPGVALGGGFGVGWRSRLASVALEGHGLLTPGRELTPSGSLTGSLLVGAVAACVHFGRTGLCAVGYAGPQWLGARDVAQPHTSAGLYLGFAPRVVLELPVARRLALIAGLEAVLNGRRNRAVLTGREVWKLPALSATLSVGVGTSFL